MKKLASSLMAVAFLAMAKPTLNASINPYSPSMSNPNKKYIVHHMIIVTYDGDKSEFEPNDNGCIDISVIHDTCYVTFDPSCKGTSK